MTKYYAYTKPLTCRMWALFGKGASRLNYHIWRNISCIKPFGQKYDPIDLPPVNVKLDGEYSGPRVDFGGHHVFDFLYRWIQVLLKVQYQHHF